jgi:AraC family transcriptional regulator
LLGVALSGGHRPNVLANGRMRGHDFAAGSIYLRNFAEPYRAELISFDFLLIGMPAAAAADEPAQARTLYGPPSLTAEVAPVLPHIAAAFLPALARPGNAAPLLVDQLVAAIQTQLLSRFGKPTRPARKPSMLSQAQEALAKELLASRLAGDMLVANIASSCGLSRSSFMKAFGETTGAAPYQWLMDRRIEAAKQLLIGRRLSLAEIAIRCGFADQSHFTRVFARRIGLAPSAWRREI